MNEIEVVQDYECDDDGDIGSPMPVFWAKGHGFEARAFIEAVVWFCLDNDVDIPRITGDDLPVEVWQQNVSRSGGSIEFRRTAEGSTSRHSPRFPITLLDLWRPGRGGKGCSVIGCDQPWRSGPSARVVVEPTDGTGKPVSVRMWFCPEHSRSYPEPSYRIFMVPVGATIKLPA